MCYLLRTWGSSCISEETGWPLFPPVNCPSYPLSQLLYNLYLGTRPWPHISPSPLLPFLKVKVKVLVTQSSPTLRDPWTVAHQAPLSMGFSRQEYWSGLPFPPLGILPDQGIEPGSSALQADSLSSELARKSPLTTPLTIRNPSLS